LGAAAVVVGAYAAEWVGRFEICRRGVVGRWEELEDISLLDGGNVLALFVVEGRAVGLEIVFGFLDEELGMREV
jgi:hypothetical protein